MYSTLGKLVPIEKRYAMRVNMAVMATLIWGPVYPHRRGNLAKRCAQEEEPAGHLEDDSVLGLHQVRRTPHAGGRRTDFRRGQREIRNRGRADLEIVIKITVPVING